MKGRRRLLVALWLLAAGALFWLFHPVCVPLTAADLARFRQWRPIEQRTDRELFWRVFQQRHGRWYQCKSWVSRALFF
jgi:hypothetical protein